MHSVTAAEPVHHSRRLLSVSVVSTLAALGLVAAAGCRTLEPAPDPAASPASAPAERWQTSSSGTISLRYTAPDQELVPVLSDYLANGRQTVEAFFGQPYPQPIRAQVHPSRASLTASWREAWKVPDLETECWMVGSATAGMLSILSPRVWGTEACEHDPADKVHTQRFITHELVHMYHGQKNPSPELEGLEAAGWFPEGLATYVSGQLDGSRLANPREAVENGTAPAELEQAWSGKYRYGVSGSLVRFIDGTWGREAIVTMLGKSNEAELLEVIGISEADLLARWKAAVLAGPKQP